MTVYEVPSNIIITISQKEQRLKASTCPTITFYDSVERTQFRRHFDDVRENNTGIFNNQADLIMVRRQKYTFV